MFKFVLQSLKIRYISWNDVDVSAEGSDLDGPETLGQHHLRYNRDTW